MSDSHKHNKIHPFEDFRSHLKARKSRAVDDLDFEAFGASLKNASEDEEEDQMDRMKKIRELATSVAVKRRLREKLLEEPVRLMQGCAGFKYRQKLQYLRCKAGWTVFSENFVLWRKSFKTLEGHFGAGVVSYFEFLKWLFKLNCIITFFILLFIIIPQQVFSKIPSTASTNQTGAIGLAFNCSNLYTSYLDENYFNNPNHTSLYLALDYVLGTGVVENTLLYIGYYSNAALSTEVIPGLSYTYNMSLAYLAILLINFLISLLWMVRNSAQGFKESAIDSEGSSYQFCNHVFGTYDFGLIDEKNIKLKIKSINYELTHDIKEHKDESRRKNRSDVKFASLIIARTIVNLLVLCVLAGCAAAIYYGTVFSSEQATVDTHNTFVKLLVGFLPSLILTGLNIVVPLLFEKVVVMEDYRPSFELKMTLLRTVFLRLASLGILLGTSLIEASCSPQDSCRVGTGSCTQRYCWESFIGSQIYKLVIVDFFVPFIVIFFVEFPRKLIATKCACKLVKQQEFNIPKHVLDLVYSQCLYWIGSFFSPLIPAIGLLKCFFLFYSKKLSILTNYVPNKRPYRASDSSSFFLVVLLISFFLCCVPIGYSILKIPPSRGCGPFRVYDVMYHSVSELISTWPEVVQNVLNLLFSETVALPLLLVLCLLIYYLNIFNSAQKERVNILRRQLITEAKDRQLLAQMGPGSPKSLRSVKTRTSTRNSKVKLDMRDEKNSKINNYSPSFAPPPPSHTDQHQEDY